MLPYRTARRSFAAPIFKLTHYPAPVAVEFERVVTNRGKQASDSAAFLDRMLAGPLSVEPFTAEDAALAVAANQQHGSGNGRGGTLNLLDLMVHAVAKRTGRPILCTGRGFAATGIGIHPASRLS